MKRIIRRILTGFAALLVIAVGVVIWLAHRPSNGHPSTYTVRDSALRVGWLYFYPDRTPAPPRALILLLGNDIGFWEPHQDLAWRLSGEGYGVIGLDVKKFLGTLPDEPQRDSVFGPAIAALIARARHELNADTLPIIVGGHSFGAELAFWIALHAPPPGLIGVLSLNSRSTGHLFVTAGDLLMKEASGAYAFSTIDAVRHIDPSVRIALVRSEHDPYRMHDSAFAVAGGNRLRRFMIPFAGHSLSGMMVPGPFISRAVDYLAENPVHFK